MKTGIMLGLGAAAVAAVALAANPLQEAKAKSRDAEHDMAAMMEAMMKTGTPGAEHAELAKCAGDWDVSIKSWMDPNGPPQTSEGTSRLEMLFDGRYLVEHHRSSMPGMGEFEGRGILAFDNATGEYQHIWMDSMSTGMMFSTGKKSADGSLTLRGEAADCMNPGQRVQYRMVTRNPSPDKRTFEMYATPAGKQEYKSMELTYTRGS